MDDPISSAPTAVVEALRFYADASNWEARLLGTVPAGAPNEGVQEWLTGPAIDGGERARAALGMTSA